MRGEQGVYLQVCVSVRDWASEELCSGASGLKGLESVKLCEGKHYSR